MYKHLFYIAFMMMAGTALAQEVPGTVTFHDAAPKAEEAPPAPPAPKAPPLQTPFRKPAPPVAEEPQKPNIPKVNSPVVPSAEKAEDAPKEEPTIRRMPALQRKKVLPPPGEEPKPEVRKPAPEGRAPVNLIDASPVVFSLADIAVYPWREKEEYFEDDLTKITFLKARIQRGDKVVPPDNMSRGKLPTGQGILTIFPQAQVAEIPLEHVYFSQDIIFMDDEGIVTQLVYHTEIKSKKPVFSKAPARSALQLSSGSIKQYALKVGDKIAIPPR